MKVPFVDFKKEWKFFEKSFVKAFKDFGQSGIYVLGPNVEKFEKDFAKFCGYKYAVGVSTGLSALEMLLRAYNIGSGDEVITVANSAVATSLAISNIGAKPVFCDIGEDFLMDPEKIEKLITSKTKAILPVHLFGKICDMKKINEIAKKNNLIVIEDACQAHGANFVDDAKVNAKAFSFYPTKNLGALGEGGAIATNDEKVRDFVLSYRNYGQKGRYNHVMKGINGRIDPLQCALLSIKLISLKKFIAKRRRVAKKYINGLKKISGLLVIDFDEKSAYHLFVLRVADGKRNELKNYLQEKGIDTLVHYPTAIHKQLCYVDEYQDLVLENTDKFQDEILSLPCNQFLSDAEVNYIIKNIKNFFAR